MNELKRQLESLDRAFNHTIEKRGHAVLLTLIDPVHNVTVERAFAARHITEADSMKHVIQDALDELMAKS
ncbi:hypothetical protein [Pseudomonas matsuisoli]|uniref:Uncharacterized protein n=1 Tax=Pseudomonas matsuisoli TaxID=1515666 RepID=A0A917Q1Z0_9PSED|nr:hypothetical protein [Pseudomonas matsuisoli]GGK07153.1 hypothetical protein GCM10009304_36700 [Pseudomonas matsuisoli]